MTQKSSGKNSSDSQKLSRAKNEIKKLMAKHDQDLDFEAEPEMAIEVLDEKIDAVKPLEQALIFEHLFRKTIEKSIPVGIAVFDTEWNQIYVNDMFSQMVGWKEEELINKPFPQLYWPPNMISDSQEIPQESNLDRLIKSGKKEIRLLKKNGSHLWGLVFSKAIVDAGGNIIGHMMSITDISELKKTEEELRRVSAKLIDAQENERKLFAQDLHDSIGGKLTGIKYSLEKNISDADLTTEKRIGGLEDTVAVIRETIEETQRIIKNLHPSIIEDLGLIPALNGYCREFGKLYLSTEVVLNIDIEEKELPEAIKILIYRVFQEALNNLSKHSKARHASAVLKRVGDDIVLSIRDDGVGFDIRKMNETSEPHKNLGLKSMKERTELFGGKFDLKTQIGKGTRIQCSWPLSIS